MVKPAFILALGMAAVISMAASPPTSSQLSSFGSAALGAQWRKLPAAMQPSKACMDEQSKSNAPCDVTDGAGVTYLMLGDHISAKEIRRTDAAPQLPYGFAWSDSLADGQRKMRDQFHLAQLRVRQTADGALVDTGGECFLARHGGEYFRFYLQYDAQQHLKTLGVSLCIYL